MALVTIKEEYLTDIAEAIRSKNGTTEQYKPREMATAIYAIETGGTGDNPDEPEIVAEVNVLTPGNVSNYLRDGVLTIPSNIYAVRNLDLKSFHSFEITKIVIESGNTLTIHPYAFHDCTKLRQVIINNRNVYFCDYAFAYCTALTQIVADADYDDHSMQHIVGNQVFLGCSALTRVVLYGKNPYLPISHSSSVSDHYSIGLGAFDGAPLVSGAPAHIPMYGLYGATGEMLTITSTNTHIDKYAFYESSYKTITFGGSTNTYLPFIHPEAFAATAIEVINVPWSEDVVEGAPWGAPSTVTINYDYTG